MTKAISSLYYRSLNVLQNIEKIYTIYSKYEDSKASFNIPCNRYIILIV